MIQHASSQFITCKFYHINFIKISTEIVLRFIPLVYSIKLAGKFLSTKIGEAMFERRQVKCQDVVYIRLGVAAQQLRVACNHSVV